MRMKTRKTRYHCQRKRNLSHNQQLPLIGTCWKNWFSSPPPYEIHDKVQRSVVNDWLESASHTWLLLIKCQYNGAAGGGDINTFRRKTWSLWALQLGPHIALFSGKEMETKSQQGRGFVSGTLDWLVSCYNQNTLSWTMFKTQKNGLFCHDSSRVKNASSFFV